MKRSTLIKIVLTVVWLVLVSCFIGLYLEIQDIYLLIWAVILFDIGFIIFCLIKHIVFHVSGLKPLSIQGIVTAVLILILLGGISYQLWPFDYSLTVVNIKENPVVADVLIINQDHKVVFNDSTLQTTVKLWKGNYTVLVEAEGYVAQTHIIDNPIGFKLNKDINQTVELEPVYIPLSNFEFLDPTTSLDLYPSVHALGQNILGEVVDETFTTDEELMYGDYGLVIADDNFEATAVFEGDRLLHNKKETKTVVLSPDNDFIILSEGEAEYVFNFLTDFMDFSQRGLLDQKDRGFPKQFYIYKKDKILSLGKILFLFCEDQTYSLMDVDNPVYFVPKEQEYDKMPSVSKIRDCYATGLNGVIPIKIGSVELKNKIYRELLGTNIIFSYDIGNLNHNKRGIDIAFTFDIESGRYVPDSSEDYISPCYSDDYSLGLEPDEVKCNSPEFVAWMTPAEHEGAEVELEYPYPVVSGIKGFEEILDYSERYGVPTTNFIVKKDILAFNELNPMLIERAEDLIEAGLFEVGSHTRYHTHLARVEESVAENEILKSKEFLEGFFDTEVYGFRGTYLSLVDNDPKKHLQALENAGYNYHSNYLDAEAELSSNLVIHKPWNIYISDSAYTAFQDPGEFRDFMDHTNYIVTLDHPWNLIYQDGEVLAPDPTIKDNMRSVVLTAISNGGILVKAKDLRMWK